MSRVVKLVKGVRNHWKKSIFGATAVTYGISYAIESYKINRLMRKYCADAVIYGDQSQPANQRFGKILVILNPFADKRSSAETFETYCEPILNLGGLSIDIVKTNSEAHARRYVEEMEVLPEAILCAGGDGTLSEIVTGLFRRTYSKDEALPTIGLLPTGRTNTVGESIFGFSNTSKLERVKGLADASMSIVRGDVDDKDVMRIEVLDMDGTSLNVKPVYAMGSFEWSTFSEAFHKRDSYWYLASLRDYATFLFNAFSNSLTWNCSASLTYTDPCAGCSNCYVKPHQIETKSTRRWWSGFIPSFRLGSQSSKPDTDYSKIKNANCTNETNIECESSGIIISTSNVNKPTTENTNNEIPKLTLNLIKPSYGFSFINNSWDRINSKNIILDAEYGVRTVRLNPKSIQNENKEQFFYIDNESYEVKSINVTLLPKFLRFYAPKN